MDHTMSHEKGVKRATESRFASLVVRREMDGKLDEVLDDRCVVVCK